jgi:nitrogenase molybdenum-iron protein NifN
MSQDHHATTNACKLCAPLGACLALRGIEAAVPFLHGSQGCATYIRRYLISHFREPVDVAASSFDESATIFGGANNLKRGLQNVTKQYKPGLIGIATTCLAETIGEDVPMILSEYRNQADGSPDCSPELIHISTASYRGTHAEGYHDTVLAITEALAEGGAADDHVNVFPGMVSPADLRYLKEMFEDFGLRATILPDYSETLDGPQLDEHQKIPPGGTSKTEIHAMGRARASIEMGRTLSRVRTAAAFLEEKFGVPRHNVGWPIGVNETDRFFHLLSELSAKPAPDKHRRERGRLIDSYVDGHKYVFGRRAIVYGEQDLVVGITAILAEIGVQPVLCASGGESGWFARAIQGVADEAEEPLVREGVDFADIREEAMKLSPDFLIGSSKGYALARELDIPLIRVGFPIHDRIGGQRILHLGYRGAQALFDAVSNTLLARAQERSPGGYSYQ